MHVAAVLQAMISVRDRLKLTLRALDPPPEPLCHGTLTLTALAAANVRKGLSAVHHCFVVASCRTPFGFSS